MKQRLQGMILGLLIGVMLAGGTVFAGSISKTVNIAYNNIKIFIDGAEYVAKDGNGKVVEPFVYNGTTYLPVKAIANAFGKDVIWDGKTSSIYIGKKDQNQPDNYLDRIQYSDIITGKQENKVWKINGRITDYLKNDYSNGMLFYLYWAHIYDDGRNIEGDKDFANSLIDYPLNSSYKKLSGKIVLPKEIDIAGLNKMDEENRNRNNCDVFFYGDGRLIKKYSSVTTTMPFEFDIDVQGVNMLTIKFLGSNDYTYVALTDLALYK